MAVLIVEDDERILQVMQKTLHKLGLETVAADDTDVILELVRSGQVELVLMDVALDNFLHQGQPVDGVFITRLLKNDPLARQVPVLLTTAYAMRGDEERLLAASGADGYLSKPFPNTETLAGKVRAMLAHAR